VLSVKLLMGSDGRPRGMGVVSFATAEAAARSVSELDGVDLMGRKVFVKLDGEGRQERGNPGRRPPNQHEGGSCDSCWFCLSNPKADLGLVAAIGQACYLCLDKGPIVVDPPTNCLPHVLLMPIDHCSSTVSVPLSTLSELETAVDRLRRHCESVGQQRIVVIERFMAGRQPGGNHCHLNLVPVPAASAKACKAAFLAAATGAGFAFELELPPDIASGAAGQAALKQAVGDGEFFAVTLPDGTKLVHALTGRFSMSFGREVGAALIGAPDRADWQNCRLDQGGPGPDEAEAVAQLKATLRNTPPFKT